MKSVLIYFFLLSPYVSLGQLKQYDFVFDKELIWQRVYNDSASMDEIFKQAASNSWVRNPQVKGNTIYAEMIDFQLNYRKYGKGSMDTPFIYRNGKVRGAIIIEAKPDRYRVTISGAHIDGGTLDTGFGLEQVSNSMDGLFMNKAKTKFRATEWLLLYSTEFGKAFEIDQSKSSQDW